MEMKAYELPKQNLDEATTFQREGGDISAFKQLIRKMGLKVTHQRLAILGAMYEGQTHVTAQEVYERVNAQYPEIGFATVYRFLRKLAESGYVTEVRMGGLPARYELTPYRHHDHLTCVRCGRICEFENAEIEQGQQSIAQQFNFKLTGHVMELYGICQQCLKQQEGANT